MFAPAIGIAEDPVTGNANGPLGAYLVRHGMAGNAPQGGFAARMRQGEAMGRPGEVRVEVSIDPKTGQPAAVRIAGDAIIAFRTEIEL
jgi:PhzF family phenazine biosynthesis protein